ncbi:hypothetical protein SODALDRAFT_278580 [Sodiomyces alkalinus F11]|uniref:Phosphatidate phosphatase APP1 catalytic domain-containing protein n=1 Tax=Sodiomyces alkalinus (strain CBS 110278 / VKM F-3762 / F11) TaxID=1314773 RepID=A0A3N2PUG8_SODAK|nr:hypothetical protein SODALDRAFT_278580 [Sodiomyces alkalinus F11]ROT38131.1 hypothetical protein SODALDRAFT_278580 [Sodiomyces alkalinus F11]
MSFRSTKTPSERARSADDLQQRTRTERKFDEMESQFSDPRNQINTASVLPTSSAMDRLTSYLGSRNPMGRPITQDDVVWLFDNTAYRSTKPGGGWEAEFVAAVFEKTPGDLDRKLFEMVAAIAEKLGIADDASERETIKERLLPFLRDVRPARYTQVAHVDKQFRLGPTGPNGISTDNRACLEGANGAFVTSQAIVPKGTQGMLEMRTYFAEPEGWAVLSDIDDTIKITQTGNPLSILVKTFVDPPTPIPGMPELYKYISSMVPTTTPWFYLSASPYNLYPFLRGFCQQWFPPGTLILRDQSWRTVAGLLTALTLGTEEYKTDRIQKVHRWFPKRKMILVGDSTQSDPEAYGEIYNQFKGWVKLILIRKATDIDSIGIQSKNDDKRFEDAFQGVPRDAWHVFEDPAECYSIVENVVAGG